jgi:Cupin-like domain
MPAVPEWRAVDARKFREEIEPLGRPAVLRGLVGQWPAVKHAQQSAESLAAYLLSHCNDKPAAAFVQDPAFGGRFFYTDDLRGLNFSQQHLTFSKMLAFLVREAGNTSAPALYAGAVPVAEFMPGLLTEHVLDLLDPRLPRQTSLWIGNRTRVAAHWDQPQNIACVISGRRRYTLFPIGQAKNLYVGPLDRTPAGAPVSLVDFQHPDFERFPRFRQALEHAEQAELGPGDALYLPSLWVHHAEALDDFGLMINFWWQSWGPQLLSPYLTMLHSLLSIRDLPPAVREGWRSLFDLYVFQSEGEPMAHVPAAARGAYAPLTSSNSLAVIAQLQQALEQAKPAAKKIGSQSPE